MDNSPNLLQKPGVQNLPCLFFLLAKPTICFVHVSCECVALSTCEEAFKGNPTSPLHSLRDTHSTPCVRLPCELHGIVLSGLPFAKMVIGFVCLLGFTSTNIDVFQGA